MLAMEEQGLEFRATKDIDIVLIVEALTEDFMKDFWGLVEAGGYKHQQKSTGREIFYRFASPMRADYPAMIELFSRRLDGIRLPKECALIPIPTIESVASLSAILLDDHYYAFIHAGKVELGGLPCIQVPYIIPLKARAWRELSEKRIRGEAIDSRDVKKHRNDIFRIGQLLPPAMRIPLPEPIFGDMKRFLDQVEQQPFELKFLGITNIEFEQMLVTLRTVYEVY